MAEVSHIEWTDATFNPWIGCTKVSPACDNCYAENWAHRFRSDIQWGKPGTKSQIARTSPGTWAVPRKMERAHKEWFAAHGRRRRVFCASLADVFDNKADSKWRDDLWQLIRETPNLDWLLLTKRPQNIKSMLPDDWGQGYANVWLGTTIENQTAFERAGVLAEVPATIRFYSCEPLVGPLDIRHALAGGVVDWVITGGESGPGSRNADPNWYRSIRDQCAAAGVPFLFKQWGDWDETGTRVGKVVAGNHLDGRQHLAFPTVH